jgi:hypothetical protein
MNVAAVLDVNTKPEEGCQHEPCSNVEAAAEDLEADIPLKLDDDGRVVERGADSCGGVRKALETSAPFVVCE